MRHEYEIVEHPHLEYLNLFLVKLIHRRLHLHREFEWCWKERLQSIPPEKLQF